MKSIFCIVLLHIFLCCNAQDNKNVYHYKANNFDAAIFSKEAKILSDSMNSFTPLKTEIDTAEKYLCKQIKNLDKNKAWEKPVIYKNLKNYKRQYFGCHDKKGNKILIINCFDEIEQDTNKPWYKNWLIEPICIQDGGSNFWAVKFNLNSKTFFDFDGNTDCDWWR